MRRCGISPRPRGSRAWHHPDVLPSAIFSWPQQLDALRAGTASANLVYSGKSEDAIAMKFDPAYAIELPWLIFVFYWLLAGFRVNRMQRREPAGQLLARVLVMAAA